MSGNIIMEKLSAKKLMAFVLFCVAGVLLSPCRAAGQEKTGEVAPLELNSQICLSVGDGAGAAFFWSLLEQSTKTFVKGYEMPSNGIYWTSGFYTLGYRYRLPSRRLSAGVDASWCHVMDIKDPRYSLECFYLSGNFTFFYKKTGKVQYYGALDAGMGLFAGMLRIAGSFTPFGVQFGSERVSGFAELSVGHKGLVNVGVRVGL